MNYRLPKASEKPEYVYRKFNEIAKKYDCFNDFITFWMHRYWKRFVAKKTNLHPEECCLDLCCGTGDVARAVLERQPAAVVTAMDFSGNMLSLASNKNKNTIKSIRYLRGDAMNPPFSSTQFDAVTIGFGLRNVADVGSCLKMIYDLLKPRGVLVCLDIGKVRFPLIRELNQFYLFKIVPMIGRCLIPGQDMFDYLPHSSLQYPDQSTLKQLMLHKGFVRVEIHDFIFGASSVHVAYKPSL